MERSGVGGEADGPVSLPLSPGGGREAWVGSPCSPPQEDAAQLHPPLQSVS